MFRMADAPRVIWHQERAVQSQTDDITNKNVVREGAMTTLVGNHPQSSADVTLAYPVQRPQNVRREPEQEINQLTVADRIKK